jgi:hypothetical protein
MGRVFLRVLLFSLSVLPRRSSTFTFNYMLFLPRQTGRNFSSSALSDLGRQWTGKYFRPIFEMVWLFLSHTGRRPLRYTYYPTTWRLWSIRYSNREICNMSSGLIGIVKENSHTSNWLRMNCKHSGTDTKRQRVAYCPRYEPKRQPGNSVLRHNLAPWYVFFMLQSQNHRNTIRRQVSAYS